MKENVNRFLGAVVRVTVKSDPYIIINIAETKYEYPIRLTVLGKTIWEIDVLESWLSNMEKAGYIITLA